MSEGWSTRSDPARLRQVTTALWLVPVSVAFGAPSGTVSVTTGMQHHSLGVLPIGLAVLADVAGSAVLIWRFRAEQRRPGQSGLVEARAAIIVAAALAVAGAVLTVQSAAALAAGSRPGTSAVSLGAAAVLLAVLAPLAQAKRRLGQRIASRALPGDGTSALLERRLARWPRPPWRSTTRWDGSGRTGSPPSSSRPSPPPKPGIPAGLAGVGLSAGTAYGTMTSWR